MATRVVDDKKPPTPQPQGEKKRKTDRLLGDLSRKYEEQREGRRTPSSRSRDGRSVFSGSRRNSGSFTSSMENLSAQLRSSRSPLPRASPLLGHEAGRDGGDQDSLRHSLDADEGRRERYRFSPAFGVGSSRLQSPASRSRDMLSNVDSPVFGGSSYQGRDRDQSPRVSPQRQLFSPSSDISGSHDVGSEVKDRGRVRGLTDRERSPSTESYTRADRLLFGGTGRLSSRAESPRTVSPAGSREVSPSPRSTQYASLTESRTVTPPASVTSPRQSISSSTLPRSYAIEKEQTDSQLRKLELENASLKSENKSLKEKYNRSTVTITELERKLREAGNEVMTMQTEQRRERSVQRQRHQDEGHLKGEELQDHIDELTKQLELAKMENFGLEKELESSRKMSESIMSSTDNSKIIEAYKVESTQLREEIRKVKQLLHESEKMLMDEANRRKKILEEKRKLTEMNNLLKDQLEMDSTGTVADKTKQSVEKRLKVTEDRLFQERADRAGKLSEVEDKLLNENAKLQSEVKDVKRQLNREKDKLRVSEGKVKDLKEQQLNLNFLSTTGKRHGGLSRTFDGMRKTSSEVSRIVEEIEQRDGVTLDQDQEVIQYLYQKEQKTSQQLNNWRTELAELKSLRQRFSEYEEDIQKYKELLEDAHNHQKDMESILKGQITELTELKHKQDADVRSKDDLVNGMQAELDHLKATLVLSGGDNRYQSNTDSSSSGRVLELQSEVHTQTLALTQAERAGQAQQAELESLRTQNEAKDRSLEEALSQLTAMQRERSQEESAQDRKKMGIEQLNVEVKSLKADLQQMKEKNKNLLDLKAMLEGQVRDLSAEVDLMKGEVAQHSSKHDMIESQKHQLELEVTEKEGEVERWKKSYDDLERKVTETREGLITSQHASHDLHKQIEDLETKLEAKSAQYNDLYSQLHSQQTSHSSTEQKLMEAHKLADDLREELSREKMELRQVRSDADRELNSAEHKINKMSRELELTTESLESLKEQKADLTKDLEVSKVKHAELQARMVEVQADLTSMKDRERSLVKERDRLLENKHEHQLELARAESEYHQRAQELERQVQEARRSGEEVKTNLESTQANILFETKLANAELESAKKLIHGKDKELEAASITVKEMKEEMNSLTKRLRDSETALDENRETLRAKMEEFQLHMREKETRLSAYEHTSRELDGETKTRKDLETKLQLQEIDIEELKLTEMRLRAEVLSMTEERNRAKEKVEKAKSDMMLQREEFLSEIKVLKDENDRLGDRAMKVKDSHEHEKMTLTDKLNKVSAEMKAAEATMQVLNETKQQLHKNQNSMERKVDDIKADLQDRTVAYRLAEQKVISLTEQHNETKKHLEAAEQRSGDLQMSLSKAESELTQEREKLRRLREDHEGLNTTTSSAELRNQRLQQENDSLQGQLHMLEAKVENQKQQLQVKRQKSSQEHRSQLDNYDKERDRITSQLAETKSALESAREDLGVKGQEVLRYREEALASESKLRGAQNKLKTLQDSVTAQDEVHDKMSKRNMDLELELSELRGLMSRLEGTNTGDSKIDNLTRAELNRTMQEWSLRLQMLLEVQRSRDKSTSQYDQKLLEQYKQKVMDTDNKYKHEQLMHQVTKNQLKSLEDDNTKLRKLLYSKKRRVLDDVSPGKSRAELINEKIAAANIRAQSLLSSGTYGDDTYGLGNTLGSTLGTTLGSTGPFGNTTLTGTGAFERLNNPIFQSTMLNNSVLTGGGLDLDQS